MLILCTGVLLILMMIIFSFVIIVIIRFAVEVAMLHVSSLITTTAGCLCHKVAVIQVLLKQYLATAQPRLHALNPKTSNRHSRRRTTCLVWIVRV